MTTDVPLQVADLIAYELFKGAVERRNGRESKRIPISSVLSNNLVREGYFDRAFLKSLVQRVESTPVVDGYIVFIPEFFRYRQLRPEIVQPSLSEAMHELLEARRANNGDATNEL